MTPSVELLFDSAACGLVWTRQDGKILTVNPAFCNYLGYRCEDILGRRFQDFLTTGAKLFHQTHWFPLMAIQGSASEVKLDFLDHQGRKVPMVLNAQAISHSNECLYSISAFMARDRDRYERELLQARKVALEQVEEISLLQQAAADRSKFSEQLVGIVSHDLRNPLSAIRMGTDILTMDETDPMRLRTAVRINQSVDRALELIENLLDFTLVESGRPLPLKVKPMDLHASANTAIEELRWTFPEATLEHQAKGPGRWEADPAQLTRLIGNLVANAVRYGDRSKPIQIRSAVEGGAARIEVINQGAPVSPELLRSMFQPMTRGSNKGGGVGLGLYIVDQIAKGHGGEASITSDGERGTCVTVSLAATPPGSDSSSACLTAE